MILSVGPIGNMVFNLVNRFRNQIEIGHYNMRFIKPLDKNQLNKIFSNCEHIITIEDGCKNGGFGSAILEYANEMKYNNPITILGIDDVFIEHGTTEELHRLSKIDYSSLELQINIIINEFE